MSSNCFFNTHQPFNIKTQSVPVDTYADIPFVPRPYSNISHQMGGTTPPKDSINNEPKKSFYSNRVYQLEAPHLQNTLTPCSMIGDKYSDFNSNPRKCYNMYSKNQNVVGKVCTTPGTEGPLYSDENINNKINGNADWVRGNIFGVHYNDKIINDRKKYYYKTPSLKENKKTYITYDQFYPIPNRCNKNKIMSKEYPHTKNFNEGGYPLWKYPYSTTQINSRNPTQLVSKKENVKDVIDLIENFSCNSNTLNSNVFWFGTITIFASLFLCNIFLQKKQIKIR